MRLSDLDLRAHLSDPARKQRFVTPMFDLVASRYDRFTRAFSYGMDKKWKRRLIAEVASRAPAGARVVDVACGTGDLAFAAAALPGASVTGVDASEQMVALATKRTGPVGAVAPAFRMGDAARLECGDGAVDVLTAGYAYRNVPDHRAALREAARVVRPGGVLATLDFYRPESAAWRALFLAYLRIAGAAVGWWWHREPVAYGYIAPSIDAFVSARQFAADVEAAGFRIARVHSHLGGGVAIHVATRIF